jgi:hypothetical protein
VEGIFFILPPKKGAWRRICAAHAVAGRQITTIKVMLNRLTSGSVQNRASVGGTAPSGVAVNDVSDTGAAIAWSPLNGAQGHTVSRANGGDTTFTPIGAVLEPSFGDMGLRPATSYGYKVTVTLPGGSEGPSSPVVTATNCWRRQSVTLQAAAPYPDGNRKSARLAVKPSAESLVLRQLSSPIRVSSLWARTRALGDSGNPLPRAGNRRPSPLGSLFGR